MRKFLLFFLTLSSILIKAQNCDQLNIQLEAEITSTCNEATMTMIHDQLGRNYLYIAHKESGLKIYNISNINNPVFVHQIPLTNLNNLDVMSLSQAGNYVYLALGNSFNNTQSSGMAIVDVSIPESAFVTDSYTLTPSSGGSGIIKSDGNYAYLCAMVNGIVVLDVQDKNNIIFKSQFIPDFTFPSQNVDSTKINARGLEIRNDTLFLCFDAGGFRIIDANNKLQLTEIGRYSNPLMNNLPRAYNNVALENNLAYVAVDYCGVEVIDFSDPQNPSLHGWCNPYNCPNNNWFSSPVHANEIKLNTSCDKLFLSTGKSDMMVLDVSDPTAPDSCNFYGGVSNNQGTWGVELYENKIFLSYVCAIIPFFSNWSGIKALSYNLCQSTLGESEKKSSEIIVNTELRQIKIQTPKSIESLKLFNLLGEEISFKILAYQENEILIQVPNTANQSYFIQVNESSFEYLFF